MDMFPQSSQEKKKKIGLSEKSVDDLFCNRRNPQDIHRRAMKFSGILFSRNITIGTKKDRKIKREAVKILNFYREDTGC